MSESEEKNNSRKSQKSKKSSKKDDPEIIEESSDTMEIKEIIEDKVETPQKEKKKFDKFAVEHLHLEEKIEKIGENQAKEIYAALREKNIDISTLMNMSVEELVEAGVGIGKARAPTVIAIAKSIGGTVNFERLDILMKEKEEWSPNRESWSTGCMAFDNLLKGGIYLGDSYGFFGGGGVGKTQITMQCIVQMFKRKEDGGLLTDSFIPEAWVLDTEDTFDKFVIEGTISERADSDKVSRKLLLSRLESICKARNVDFNMVASHIFVSTARDTDMQLQAAKDALEIAATHPNLKLIVVDSLMKLFRAEENQGLATKAGRSQRVAQFLALITKIKTLNNSAVIVTNQAYEKMDGTASIYGPEYSQVEPGGGSAHHNINNRVHLFVFQGKRYAKIADSSWLPNEKDRFIIDDNGVSDFIETTKDKKKK